MFSELLKDSTTKIIAEMGTKSQAQDEKIEKLYEMVENLRSMTEANSETLSSLIYIIRGKKRKNNDNEREMKIEVELMLLDKVFNESVVERVLEVSKMCTIADHLRRLSKLEIRSQASKSLQTIMYSKPNKGSQHSCFSSGVGKGHSLFRESIVLTLIDSVRKNKFDQFSQEDTSEKPRSSGPKNIKPTYPQWLKKGYIRH